MQYESSVLPTISVITVTFNAGQQIEKTIKSLISQTYKNIEYIIIDGNSKDSTIDIIHKYEPYISYWISEEDAGIYDAMNKGIDAAKGELMIFLNSADTLFNSTVLENFIQNFYEHKKSFIYLCRLVTDRNELIIPKYVCFTRQYKLPTYHQGIIYPAEIMKSTKYFTEFKIASDFHNFHIITRDYPTKSVNLVLTYYDTSGISSKDSWELNQEYIRIYNDLGVSKLFCLYREIRGRVVAFKELND